MIVAAHQYTEQILDLVVNDLPAKHAIPLTEKILALYDRYNHDAYANPTGRVSLDPPRANSAAAAGTAG
jgi:hypothetical protein